MIEFLIGLAALAIMAILLFGIAYLGLNTLTFKYISIFLFIIVLILLTINMCFELHEIGKQILEIKHNKIKKKQR